MSLKQSSTDDWVLIQESPKEHKINAEAENAQAMAKTAHTLQRDRQIYEGHSFVHGASPTWLQFSFCDLFADPFLDVKQRKLEQDVMMGISKARKAAAQALETKETSTKTKDGKESSDGQGKEAIVQLAMSMKFVNNIFQRLLSEELGDCSRHVNSVQHALQEALQIGARLPIGKCEDIHTSFLAFLQYFVGRVSAMRPGSRFKYCLIRNDWCFSGRRCSIVWCQ